MSCIDTWSGDPATFEATVFGFVQAVDWWKFIASLFIFMEPKKHKDSD